MNNFQENTWAPALVALDGSIAAAFDGLELSRSQHEGEVEAWRTAEAAHIDELNALVAKHEHEARKAHWLAELARIDAAPAPVVEEPAAPVEELAPVVEELAPAEEPTLAVEESPRPRRGRGG